MPKLAHNLNQALDVITDGKPKGESGMVEDITLDEETVNIDDVSHEAGISRHSVMGKVEKGNS